jgi:hypothetical protein
MAKSTSVAVRSYRIYFRDSMHTLSPPFEVDLGSDGEARDVAQLMLHERSAASAEVWDRARLVCVARVDAA